MDEMRFGESVRDMSRKLVSDDGAYRKVILFAYVIVATVIAGAANGGAGLFILAIGLLMLLAIDHTPWRVEGGSGTASAASDEARTAEPAVHVQLSLSTEGDGMAASDASRPPRRSKAAPAPEAKERFEA